MALYDRSQALSDELAGEDWRDKLMTPKSIEALRSNQRVRTRYRDASARVGFPWPCAQRIHRST
jgi:hypothetical protein